MARAPSLSFSRAGLSPFKRTGAAFSMFSVVDTENEAYLEFSKVDVKWQAGIASDDEYMTALRTYANSFDAESAEYLRAQERVRETEYNIARDKIVSQVNKGTKSLQDLLDFDTQAMVGMEPGNQEFRTRRDRLEETSNKEAYDEFNKVREKWQAGLVQDTAYLSAFSTYVGKLTNPDEQRSAQLSLDAARYTLARNALVNAINKGNRSVGDLLEFDQLALTTGVVPGSDEYRQRLGRLQESQRAVFSDQEQDQNLAWQQGRLTTNQLLRWYEDQSANNLASGNQELQDRINSQLDSLRMRVQDERDSKMVDDFNNGKIGANAFLAYARDARDRYLTNTPQFRDWQTRIDDATKRTTEDNLLYRYEMSQNYSDLKRFVATHKKAPWEGGSSSEDTRWVLQDDGTWKPVTTTTNTAYTPTDDQRQSWAEIQAQVAESKAQMRYIEQQISTVPGGWVDNQHLLNYYSGIQHDYVAGSTEWYTIQQKIDQVHESMSQENVYKTIGITITYPWTAQDPQHTGGGTRSPDANDPNRPNPNPHANQGPRGYNNPGPSHAVTQGNRYWGNAPVRHAAGTDPHGNGISVDEFLYALGQHESGGNYSARNGGTGAFGKYQHLPQYWPSRARKFLGDANAAMTPENQEKVTRGMVQAIYNRWGDWRIVALIWHGGAGAAQKHDPNDPSTWSLRNQKYVNRTMNILGSDMWTPTNQQGVFLPNDWTGGGGTPTNQGPHPGSNNPQGPHSQPYDPNAPYTPPTAPGQQPGAQNPRSPDANERPNPPRSHGPQFLREFTGTSHTDAFGSMVPTTRRTGIPDWASDNSLAGTNFEDFYGEFLKAFNNGDTSVTFFRQGKTTTYFIPGDPARRQAMMASLDDIRIGLHGTRAAAYWQTGDTDLARTADAAYEGSVKQQGVNMLKGMTQPDTTDQEDAYQKFRAGERGDPERGPNLNPIADADTYLKSSQAYIDMHTKLAQDAYDRGDYTAALAHIQRATNRQAEADVHMNQLLGQAESMVSQIQGSTGADLPDSVRTSLDDLRNWNEGLDLSDMDKLAGELTGTRTSRGVLDGTWQGDVFIPKRDPLTGNIVLRQGIQLVFDNKGNVTYDELPPPVTDPRTGLPIGQENNGRVPTTTRIGNTMATVYADSEIGVVGSFSDGTLIYGRRAWDPRMSRWTYENPFQPGHWSTAIIVYKLPPGAQAIPLDPNHPAATQITFIAADGTHYGLSAAPDDSGSYILTNLTNGLSFRTDDTNISVNDQLSAAGFNRDISFVSVQDRGFTDTSGPVFGMTPQDYNKWINTATYGPSLGRILEHPPEVVAAVQKSIEASRTPTSMSDDEREARVQAGLAGVAYKPKTVSAATQTAVDNAIALSKTPQGVAADNREASQFAARQTVPVINPSTAKLPPITPPPHITQSQAPAASNQEHLGRNRNQQPTDEEKRKAAAQRERYKLPTPKPPPRKAPTPTKKQTFFDTKLDRLDGGY